MTFAARPLVIGVLLAPFKPSLGQFAVISWAGLRGAASIVFAIMVTVNDSFAGGDIYHIVFCVVLYSIILQGTLLPILSRKVNMIDENSDVLRTFTDYVDETEVQFIQLPITPGHPWIGNAIKDLTLVPDTLLAAIQRGDKVVVPKGDTVIEENDLLILAAMGYQDTETIRLKKFPSPPPTGGSGNRSVTSRSRKTLSSSWSSAATAPSFLREAHGWRMETWRCCTRS